MLILLFHESMCGRYELKASGDALKKHFNLEEEPHQDVHEVNHTPGRPTITVVHDGSWNRIMEAGWKRISEPGKPYPLWTINARIERAFESRAFRDSVRGRRCLIPATAFYEFPPRGPVRFSLRDNGLFAMAGIWKVFQEKPLCAILTTSPAPAVAPYHDRMPVILKPWEYPAWLDPTPADEARLARLLNPAEEILLTAQPVEELAAENPEYAVLLPRQREFDW